MEGDYTKSYDFVKGGLKRVLSLILIQKTNATTPDPSLHRRGALLDLTYTRHQGVR